MFNTDTVLGAAAATLGSSAATYQLLTDVLSLLNLGISLAVGVGGLVLLYFRLKKYISKEEKKPKAKL